MKIAIIELDTKNHNSLIYNWIKVSEVNKWDCTLFTTKDIYNNVIPDIQWIRHKVNLKKDEESVFFYLKRIQSFIKKEKFDILIILTLQTHFLEFLLVNFSTVKTGVTLHNSRTWFYKNNVQKVSHLLKKLCRKLWINRASFFIVNSENMSDYIIKNFAPTKDIHVMPFSLRKNDINCIMPVKQKVVYPGMISKVRKRYTNFLLLAEENPQIDFVLLGAPNAREGGVDVINDIDERKLTNVKYFLDFVDANTFGEHMRTCSLIFSELNLEYSNSDFLEIYGLTKDSGVSYLMYEFSKPGLFNNEFKNLNYLENATIYFKDVTELRILFKRHICDLAALNDLESKIIDSHKIVNLNSIAQNLLQLNGKKKIR
jgi:hypothetical protein